MLAERPILRRLLSASDRQDLVRACSRDSGEDNGVEACTIFDGAQLVAASGPEIPWTRLYPLAEEQGERFMAAPAGRQLSVIGAVARLPSEYNSFTVMVVRLLDKNEEDLLSAHSGLEVHLINYRTYAAAPDNEFTSLHSEAQTLKFSPKRIESLGSVRVELPILASSGETVALIETRASASHTDTAVRSLVWRLIITAVVLAVLAVVAGVLLGWRVTRPAEALTDAAVRLGQGDFATSIPTAGPAEIGQLARTMDDMRRNLLDLNSELRHREAEAQVMLEAVVEGVRRRPGTQHPLSQPAGGEVVRYRGAGSHRQVLWRRAQALRPGLVGRFIEGYAALRDHGLSHPARPPGRQRAVGGTAADSRGQPPGRDHQFAHRTARRCRYCVTKPSSKACAARATPCWPSIGHEFRTPLAAQLASIELLRDGLKTAPPEKLEELVLSLERGTLRLTRLIDNLLESVRIESGQLGLRRQSIELADVIEDSRVLVEALLRQRQQALEVDVPEGLTLQGDATRLTQVFVNLIANASKFAPEDAPIYVGAGVEERPGGPVVQAWVEDSGPGLPEGDTVGIFERFKRGGAQEPEPGGLGLGLWISRSIVERHGGTLTASRTDKDRTRFTLTLPQSSS